MNHRRARLLFFNSKLLTFSLAVVLTAGVCKPSLEASEGVIQAFENEIQGIFTRTKNSVVQIKTIPPIADSKKEDIDIALSIGTGFFVDNKGHVFTAASVLRGATNAIVYWNGKSYEAQLVGIDLRSNLALLKIDAQTPSLPFGDHEALKVGSLALAVGFPADGPLSVEYGEISSLDAANTPIFAISHIRSSVHVHPGQSGSPFLNSKGEVVGMVVYSTGDGSSTFSLPIDAARKIQRDLMTHHAPRYGWTGLTISLGNQPTSETGIPILDVYENSPSHQAGIKKNDVLLKIGPKAIHSPADVMNATFYLSIGETVDFTVQRDGEKVIVPVKAAPVPSNLALKPTPIGR